MPLNGSATSLQHGSSPTASSTPDQLSMFDLTTLPVSSNAISSQASADGPSFCEERDGLTTRSVWTGSCPCQPFSLLGKQAGYADPRHLWPTWARLIAERRPATIFGEQLATAPRWLRLVRGDLEALGYAVGSLPIEAACAGAGQSRDRYWFIAQQACVLVNGIEPRLEGHARHVDQARAESQAIGSAAASGFQFGSGTLADSAGIRSGAGLREGFTISDGAGAASGSRKFDLAICRIDGRVRRIKPGLRLVADGIPARVDKLRALGNAIDPRPAAAFIRAAMQCIGAK